jgi:2-amino-4-hydroxy-6-hydroxymethyldihydropteridine diphosphokinase
MHRVFLGLGSNIGDKQNNLRLATDELERTPGISVLKTSSFYKSAPWGYKDQDWFLNGVVEISTALSALELLRAVKDIETHMGRQPSPQQWGPRLIDIDILLYNQEIIQTPELTIPHPFLTERLFVLIPLLELDPDLRHPQTNVPLEYSLRKLDQQGEIVPWSQ